MSITWNGVSSDTIGVVVERIPNRYVPTRRFSPQQAAGRNGNILLVDKSFPNVEQEYEVYLSAEAQGLPSVARACAEWLMGPDGYCRLEDSYDPTVYREAFLMGGYDLENILNKFGRCTITFSCKPQKYLLTGDTPISIPAGTTTTYTGSSVQFDGITGASITSMSTTITPTQAGSGDPSPTNVRPITGLTGLSVYRTGKNLYSRENSEYNVPVYSQNGSSAAYPDVSVWWIRVKPSTKYTISLGETPSSTTYVRWINCDENKGFISRPSGTYSSNSLPVTITTPSGCHWVQVAVNEYGTGQISQNDWKLQIEESDTATSYEAFGNTYAVDWSTPAGTVYGGTVDVVAGALTVTMANIASYNGETIGEPWLSSMDAYAAGTTPTIGAQVVYTLATPLTYQLTAQEVAVLVGTNNIWASSGDVSLTVTTPLGGIVTNPTPFEARPMLTVSGVGEITINGKSIQILESVSDFDIDCETMEAEDNSKIYCMDFPELSGGANSVSGDGTITAMSIVPRWWTL